MIKETFPKRLFPSPSPLLRNFYSIRESNCQVVLPDTHVKPPLAGPLPYPITIWDYGCAENKTLLPFLEFRMKPSKIERIQEPQS